MIIRLGSRGAASGAKALWPEGLSGGAEAPPFPSAGILNTGVVTEPFMRWLLVRFAKADPSLLPAPVSQK